MLRRPEHKNIRDVKNELRAFKNLVTNCALAALIAIGLTGFGITIAIDAIRQRPQELDYLQLIGMGVFTAIWMLGVGLWVLLGKKERGK